MPRPFEGSQRSCESRSGQRRWSAGASCPAAAAVPCPSSSRSPSAGRTGARPSNSPTRRDSSSWSTSPSPSDRGAGNEPTSLVAYFLKMMASPRWNRRRRTYFRDRCRRRRPGRPGQDAAGRPTAAEPKADDPAGAGRFASKPGPYVLDAIRGTLSAKVDGQSRKRDPLTLGRSLRGPRVDRRD